VVGRPSGLLSMLYLVKVIEIYKIIVSKLISRILRLTEIFITRIQGSVNIDSC